MEILAGFDTETTGLEPGDHRLVEVYVGLWRDEKLIYEYEQRINPERSIPAESQRIHGIAASDLMSKPIWSAMAPTLHKVLSKADRLIAHNAPFDLNFLRYEFKRVGLVFPERPTIDTGECVWATHDGKKPTLEEFCFATGVEYDRAKAHAAAYDVRDTLMPAFFKARQWGFVSNDQDQAKKAA